MMKLICTKCQLKPTYRGDGLCWSCRQKQARQQQYKGVYAKGVAPQAGKASSLPYRSGNK